MIAVFPRLERAYVSIALSPYAKPNQLGGFKAIVLGPLAVTPSLWAAGGWCITHVATGGCLDDPRYGRFETRSRAVAAMRELVSLCLEWDVSKWNKHLAKRRQKICAEIFKKHGGLSPYTGRAE